MMLTLRDMVALKSWQMMILPVCAMQALQGFALGFAGQPLR